MSSTNVPTRRDSDTTLAPLSNAQPSLVDEKAFEKRYAQGDVIGKGGMGVVWSCTDRRIGRDVAMKTLKSDLGDESMRFLREACVQGQLEHPAIVPIHDLGRNERGELFFTMKRIRGVTLREILQKLREGDPETQQQYSRRKLLGAFATVCNAIQFAHARGVVHRDLKPANVMFGHFGEVYVLDWGVAKVFGWDETLRASLERVSAADQTHDGAQIGTPGYMSPEQVKGETADARSDVYSLGAILFELLTLERLNPKEDALVATIEGAEARPSKRTPNIDVPPELEAICVNATALDPADRFSSVRAMTEALERFLDGDRDLERRRELAIEHATKGAELGRRALDGGTIEGRAEALREIGRALALDPENSIAAETFLRLMAEPPKTMPEEVRNEVRLADQWERTGGLREAARSQLAPIVLLPLLLLMGGRPVVYLPLIAAVLTSAVSWLEAKRKTVGVEHGSVPVVLAGCLMNTLFAAWFGPYVVVPSISVLMTVLPIVGVRSAKLRVLFVAAGCAPIVMPSLLAWLGIIPPFYGYGRGVMTITTHFDTLTAPLAEGLCMAATLSIVFASAFIASKFRAQLSDAQETLHLQAWQLRQLVGQRPV